jgi:hypothetical protein
MLAHNREQVFGKLCLAVIQWSRANDASGRRPSASAGHCSFREIGARADMLIMKPQDTQVTDRLEPSTDRVCRREGKLTGVAIIGISMAVVSISDVVRQHLMPDSNIWFLGFIIPIWFLLQFFMKYRRD